MSEDAAENPRSQASPGTPPGSASESMPDYENMRKNDLMKAANVIRGEDSQTGLANVWEETLHVEDHARGRG